MKISIDQEHFGTLCICAVRYCFGRMSYMPGLVQDIVGAHLKELSDKSLAVMLDDCDFQDRMNLYGDESIDKPGWIKWRSEIEAEIRRRQAEQ